MSNGHEVVVGFPSTVVERLTKLDTIVGKQDDIIHDLRKMAFQLANFYFVSQAVVFTALAGDSSLVCHDVWFPLVLSLLPGFLNLYALAAIGNDYKKAIIFRDQSDQQREKLRAGTPPERVNVTEDVALKTRLTIKFYACMIVCTVFSIVIAFGSFWMLCGQEKFVKHHGDDDAKCLKLCEGGKCIRICPKS